MTMRFPFRHLKARAPVVPLAGRLHRPRPILSVTVIGPGGSWALDGLLDSGSDDTIFPERVAGQIGIDLSNAPTGMGAGAGLGDIPIRYARVALRIADNRERREWPAWVGFATTRVRYPMLGFAGFLQYFTATFLGEREEVELTVNALYPGT